MVYRNTPAQDYVQSDYSNAARLNLNGSAQEQKFMENLIDHEPSWYLSPRTIW